jgi:hypothetical protein
MTKKRKKQIIFSIIGLFLLYALIEPYCIQTVVYNEVNPNFPVEFEGKKIVFIADIHHKYFFSVKRVRALVNSVNQMKPDVILLGGDYIVYSSKYAAPCFAELKSLHAPLGVYGVLGNHDYWEGKNIVLHEMKNAGIIPLVNEAKWLIIGKRRIKIGGTEDYWEGTADIAPTLAGTTEKDTVILLSHNPDIVETITDKRIDLVLSGHTHGGQVTFFGLWAPFIPSACGNKYRTGLIKTNFTKVLVTNGVGSIGVPFRFFAPPQINVIFLQRK